MGNSLTAADWWASKDVLDNHLRAAREAQLARELRLRLCRRLDCFLSVGSHLLHRYLGQHPRLRAYGLNVADLALTPEVREIAHRPEDAHVDMDNFAIIEETLEGIIDSWRIRVCNRLHELIGGRADYESAVDALNLAVTMFTCKKCGETCLRFPNVFTHKCQRPEPIGWTHDAWEDIVRRRNGLRGRPRISNSDIGFALSLALWPSQHSESAHQVVRMCGKDPWTTTAEEMDALNVRFVQGKTIMTWGAAVSGAVDPSLLHTA